MESLAQQLQNALPNVPVYLGSEWLEQQPQLPFMILLPTGGQYTAPSGQARLAIADVQLDTTVICKAALFEEALLLAEVAYAALAQGKDASVKLRSEVWGDYTVRVADLTFSTPAVLTRDDVALVHVKTFTQRVHVTPPTSTPEVPDDAERPEGTTHFQ
ncbi:hypothetical protein GCM10010844_38460 [Deinococcus radiotolerans]|uniref:Uncharacterized protein n=1 Tax=Deinococcus radiotolerans TaxID=1309407 RepID=A0ABQ2FQ60_9DEIO|nr:hypothetical protein GCM10010844_38460 [Deinococcus radiotolerans]